MTRRRLATALLFALALHSRNALASEWDGTSGDFFDSTHWTPPAVPGPSDTALFDQGGNVSFSADATTLNALITGSAPTTFTLNAPDLNGSQGTISHSYTLADSAPGALSATDANFTVTGGNLLLPSSGFVFNNTNATFGPNTNVTSGGLSQINNGSILTITGNSILTADSIAVANSGSGSLVVGPNSNHDSRGVVVPSMAVTHDVSLAAQPGTTAHLLIQKSLVTIGGTLYVGGSAVGPGGIADLQLPGYQNTYGNSSLQVNHLVVYAGSTILTNQCSNISTTVSDIAGNVELLSAGGGGGGLQASSAINLLAGSRTHIAAPAGLVSPTITLSSGAVLVGDFNSFGGLSGNLINGGELDSFGFTIGAYTANTGNYTQLQSGVLSGTAGDVNLLTLPRGTASVNGTLRLTFDNPATVHAGDSFAIISAASISGQFDQIDLVGLTGFSAQFSDLTGRLTLLSSTDNGNNGDNGGGDAQPPVPEPASLALLPLALVALGARLHRRPF